MAFRIANLFLLFGFLSLTATGQTNGPVVEEFSPDKVSGNSVLELRGYRLHPSFPDKIKAYFLQNGNTHLGRAGGGSSVTNDENNGRQTLEVIVPEEVELGPAQVVIEIDGIRSTPITVTIVEWKLPNLISISPTHGSPGTDVLIVCSGFHINDEIELRDTAGKLIVFPSGGSSRGTGFRVPKDVSEGPMTIRLGSSKFGNQFTEPLKFLVTNDPLPLELASGSMTPVAPGQWLDLQLYSDRPLKLSERTEVAFKQGGQQIVVATPNPRRPHVLVPAALSPGEVMLQTRTWRKGQPSVWSKDFEFKLTDRPARLMVNAIRLADGVWVQLWPGPDRPQSFSASAGDSIVLNGLFRVVDAAKLKIWLVGSAGEVELPVSELDPKADWFGDVIAKLPATLAKGDWRMHVANTHDGTQVELPIVIQIR